MTTVELANRLLKYLKIKDLAMVPADAAQEILDAINGAIHEYYRLVPSQYKRTTLGGWLSAPQVITANFTQYSTTFTGWNAAPSQKGCTILVPTDQNQNFIVGQNQLLNPYTGPTGTIQATVYGDVIQMSQAVERYTGEIRCLENRRILIRDETFRSRSRPFGWGAGWGGYFEWPLYGSIFTRQVGQPKAYWVEQCGQSQGANPPFWVRMTNLPDRYYTVNVEADIAPYRIVMQDLTIPRQLPLDNYSVEECVLLMAPRDLVMSNLWENPKLMDYVMKNYDRGCANATKRPHNQAVSKNYVGTPLNW